ncbi:MAG: bifunctional DNA-formamidopyrimidine glycosylase/DNA-(apurinic or apyrimidinic site) lyase [Candidatus Paceibacterota bacterium]
MPELPEVHTTATQLKNEVLGKTITAVWSDFHIRAVPKKGQLKDPDFYTEFAAAVTGATVTGVDRRGKNILLHLNPSTGSEQTTGTTVLIHLKLTGHLLVGSYQKNERPDQADLPENWREEPWIPIAEKSSPLWDPYNRFIHLIFCFNDGTHLALSDMRRFAKVLLLGTDGLARSKELTSLGPDPRTLSPLEFQEHIHSKRSGRIKTVLLDQSVIAGVGNIYSDEALFAARIHPETDVTALTDEQLTDLRTALKAVIDRAIETGGDSDGDYRDLYGRTGTFQNFHHVYRKTGSPCPRTGCSDTIERIVVGGRSAHFCPLCQTPA